MIEYDSGEEEAKAETDGLRKVPVIWWWKVFSLWTKRNQLKSARRRAVKGVEEMQTLNLLSSIR